MKTKNTRPKPGKGYRFLTEEEVRFRESLCCPGSSPDIERYSPVSKSWSKGWQGTCPGLFYRTQKPRGYFLTTHWHENS